LSPDAYTEIWRNNVILGRVNGVISGISMRNARSLNDWLIPKLSGWYNSLLNPCPSAGPVDMRKFFLWIRRDKDGQARIQAAQEESRRIGEEISEDINGLRKTINVVRDVRRKNHIAELFEEEFGRGRG
jgi:hypothetical protein